MQVKVTSDMEFLRVRSGAGTAAPVVGYVENGATLEIDHEHPLKDAKGRNWYPVTLPVYSSVLYADEARTKVWYGTVSGYVAGWLLDIDQAEPEPEPEQPPEIGWSVSFYNSEDLSGVAVKTIQTDAINFNWGDGSPGVGIRSDLFSARATRTWVCPKTATYKFKVKSDDGATVELDGQKIINAWIEQSATDYSAYVDVSAGTHMLASNFFEHGGNAVWIVDEPVEGTAPIEVVNNDPPTLGGHTITSAEAALDLEARGAKFITIMDNEVVARDIKARHPDITVVFRRYISNWTLGGAALADRIGNLGPDVWVELYNEADNFGYGTENEIRNRIDQELIAMNILLSRGMKVLLGCYSMGCPDYWNPKILAQVNRYATHYNNNPRVGITVHNYSPTWRHIYSDDALIWYERRWEKLFTDGDLDPSKRKLFVTETGPDNGGGLAEAGLNYQQQFDWFNRWGVVQSRPVVKNGVSYPSPVVGGSIFQYDMGKDQKWAGFRFDVEALAASQKWVRRS